MSLVIRRRRRFEINVVPLIDVMVVLVFFLLLGGRLEESHTLAITPPTTTSGAEGASSATLVLGVDRSGLLYVEGREIAATALKEMLARRAQTNPASEVLIVADERSTTGAAVAALDAVAQAGLRPRLLTRPPR